MSHHFCSSMYLYFKPRFFCLRSKNYYWRLALRQTGPDSLRESVMSPRLESFALAVHIFRFLKPVPKFRHRSIIYFLVIYFLFFNLFNFLIFFLIFLIFFYLFSKYFLSQIFFQSLSTVLSFGNMKFIIYHENQVFRSYSKNHKFNAKSQVFRSFLLGYV